MVPYDFPNTLLLFYPPSSVFIPLPTRHFDHVHLCPPYPPFSPSYLLLEFSCFIPLLPSLVLLSSPSPPLPPSSLLSYSSPYSLVYVTQPLSRIEASLGYDKLPSCHDIRKPTFPRLETI